MNEYPSVLDGALDFGRNDWRSPIAADDFAEYWDESFLRLLGAEDLGGPLSAFWPKSGPRWDALGLNRAGALVLVEAKAHARELETATSAGLRSLEMIQRAFAEMAAGWRTQVKPEWTSTYYQYTNRLAHAYFFNELHDRPTILAFVHILGDPHMRGPRTRDEWEVIIDQVHRTLGLEAKLPPYVVDAFIDVSSGVPVAA